MDSSRLLHVMVRVLGISFIPVFYKRIGCTEGLVSMNAVADVPSKGRGSKGEIKMTGPNAGFGHTSCVRDAGRREREVRRCKRGVPSKTFDYAKGGKMGVERPKHC